MDEIFQIGIAIVASLIYFVFVTGRKRSQKEDQPSSLVSPDPAPEPKPEPQKEEKEPEPKITFQDLLKEFLPEPEKKNEENDKSIIDLQEEEPREAESLSLKPKFKQEEVNLEKLAIQKVAVQPKVQNSRESQSFSEMMQNPSDFRNAFILSQILDRPYQDD